MPSSLSKLYDEGVDGEAQLTLEVRPSVEAFLANPTNAVVAGASWLYFCAAPTLYGIVFWGRPSADDVRILCRALAGELATAVEPHVSYVDARGVDSVDGEAFAVLSQYVQANHAALSRKVTRLALVRPAGFPGAVTAGFYEVLDSPYPAAVFATPADALAWLEHPLVAVHQGRNPTGLALDAQLTALRAQFAGVSPLVAKLRIVVEDALLDIDLPRAAKLLAVSPRTLQRRLAEQDTSFASVVVSVRIAVAERKLRDSDASLTAIAHEIGCASAQHFSTLFREHTGKTPSEWRAQVRGAR